MGKTSGMEVIRRLLKKGLIRQFAEKQDKRSQLVMITPKGLKEMKKIFPKMQKVSGIITGNLSRSEQEILVFLLQKLGASHNQLFLTHKDEDLEIIKQMGDE